VRRGRGALVVLLLLSAPRAFSAGKDPIGDLITGEQSAYEQWLSDADDPPAALLNGDAAAVEIIGTGNDADEATPLCAGLDLPSLIDLTGGDATKNETVLNFNLPRVREEFGDACLVRPGDRVIAVGPGGEQERRLTDFVIRRDAPPCPGASPWTLVARFDKPLDASPFFYTTDPGIEVSTAAPVPAAALTRAAVPAALQAPLAALVPFPEEFSTEAWQLPGSSTSLVAVLTRRQPGTDDDGLPAMVLAASDGAAWQPLWTERVDLKKGSGRFEIEAVTDFDGDGSPEIVVRGTHQGCGYRAVFADGEDGWKPLPLPVKPCGC
jgi:hypothetical protein